MTEQAILLLLALVIVASIKDLDALNIDIKDFTFLTRPI
jgi:hypothetical protein